MKTSLKLIWILLASSTSLVAQPSIFRTYTGISGFWDYQTNQRTPQYLRGCPGSSAFHTVMMIAFDSLLPDVSRRTAYAYSTNAGMTWTTFNDLYVPQRRSGFPALDLGMGTIACAPIIANYSDAGYGLQSYTYIDDPPGEGAFAELGAPPPLGADEPIWPEVAGAADGSIFLVATRPGSGTIHYSRTSDYLSWSPFGEIPGSYASGGGYVAEANSRNRIGVVLSGQMGISWFESTNNGISWPSLPVVLLPPSFTVGSDTFLVDYGIDLVYSGVDTLMTFGVSKVHNGQSAEGIGFWSEHTGFVLAVPHDSVSGAVDSLRRPQARQRTVGMPCIGLSGSSIVIGFQSFMAETSAAGFNYSDIFFTFSTDGGSRWSRPFNVTATPFLDERYPGMSKWNVPGQANLVWQEDPQPGSAVFNDNSPLAHVRQVFCRISNFLTTVDVGDGRASGEFALDQNYPNPFNPSTTIHYSFPSQVKDGVRSQHVLLKVYDVLGREVATLVNEWKEPGSYEVVWDATKQSSGIYFCQLQTGPYRAVRKVILLK